VANRKSDGSNIDNFLKAAKKTQFKKGVVHKSNGRRALTPEQRALKSGNRGHVSVIMNIYLTMTPKEVDKELENGSLPVLDVAILRHLKIMHENGDCERMDWILNHVFGKKATQIEVKTLSHINIKRLSIHELRNLREIAGKSE